MCNFGRLAGVPKERLRTHFGSLSVYRWSFAGRRQPMGVNMWELSSEGRTSGLS